MYNFFVRVIGAAMFTFAIVILMQPAWYVAIVVGAICGIAWHYVIDAFVRETILRYEEETK